MALTRLALCRLAVWRLALWRSALWRLALRGIGRCSVVALWRLALWRLAFGVQRCAVFRLPLELSGRWRIPFSNQLGSVCRLAKKPFACGLGSATRVSLQLIPGHLVLIASNLDMIPITSRVGLGV